MILIMDNVTTGFDMYHGLMAIYFIGPSIAIKNNVIAGNEMCLPLLLNINHNDVVFIVHDNIVSG